MKKIEVFDGCSLHDEPITYDIETVKCVLKGSGFSAGKAVTLDEELLSRHIMLLGGIGTGKTNVINLIVQQLLQTVTENDVMIIFDTKGDFYKEFHRPGDIVISNDSHASGANGPDYWNIYGEIERDEHMEENINEIASAVFRDKIDHSTQPFFPNAAKDIFSAVLNHFIKNGNEALCNNRHLRQFLDTAPTSTLRKMLNMRDETRSMVSYIQDDDSGQTQGVISELQQAVKEIFMGNFKKEGSLSLRQLVRQKGGQRIFIEYDLGVGATLAPIYSLMFDLAIKEALCRNNTGGNVYFITDEFSLLPGLQHMGDAVNFGRSLGIKFLIGFQNIEQLHDIYGEARAKSLLSGFLTQIFFRCNDASSRRFIQETFGANRKKEIYMASVQGRGIVEQIRDAHVVEDWDISRLDRGDAIIGLPGAEPFKFHFEEYIKRGKTASV